jgi:hypothetical protein
MKAYYLLVPLCAAILGGCTVYPPVAYTAPPARVAVAPTYVTPTYVAPAYTVVAP